MTDTITPASLREHANHMAAVKRGNGPVVQALVAEADRLEAESARDEEALEYAKVYRSAIVEVAPIQVAWDGLPDDYREMHVRGVRAVLDHLAADGRLFPEGGMVLTAEQVAEARELLDAVDLDAEEFHLLRSAFSPPAVAVPDSGEDRRLIACARCNGSGSEPVERRSWKRPEPIPEGVRVTDREGRICERRNGVMKRVAEDTWCGGLDGPFTELLAGDEPTTSVPDSGPDGTPEKPWPTWQDVLEGVRYQGSTRYGDRSPVFVNREGQRITEWHPGVEFANTHPDWVVDRWAPFVRVDGDKA